MTLVRARDFFRVGVLSLALAVYAVFGPLPPGTRSFAESALSGPLLAWTGVLAAVAVGFAVVVTAGAPGQRASSAGSGSDADGTTVTRGLGDGTSGRGIEAGRHGDGADGRGEPVGGDVQTALATAERTTDAPTRVANERTVRRQLETSAVTVVADSDGISRAAAAERVATGEWTDDPRAAALLADGDAAELSLSLRVVDWLGGNPFERQVNAAVAEIAARAGVETEVSGP